MVWFWDGMWKMPLLLKQALPNVNTFGCHCICLCMYKAYQKAKEKRSIKRSLKAGWLFYFSLWLAKCVLFVATQSVASLFLQAKLPEAGGVCCVQFLWAAEG